MNISSTFSAWSSALKGMNAGFKQVDQSAATIAHQAVAASNEPSRPGRADNDLNNALVQQKQATYTVQANVKSFQTANSMIGSVLDMMA